MAAVCRMDGCAPSLVFDDRRAPLPQQRSSRNFSMPLRLGETRQHDRTSRAASAARGRRGRRAARRSACSGVAAAAAPGPARHREREHERGRPAARRHSRTLRALRTQCRSGGAPCRRRPRHRRGRRARCAATTGRSASSPRRAASSRRRAARSLQPRGAQPHAQLGLLAGDQRRRGSRRLPRSAADAHHRVAAAGLAPRRPACPTPGRTAGCRPSARESARAAGRRRPRRRGCASRNVARRVEPAGDDLAVAVDELDEGRARRDRRAGGASPRCGRGRR